MADDPKAVALTQTLVGRLRASAGLAYLASLEGIGDVCEHAADHIAKQEPTLTAAIAAAKREERERCAQCCRDAQAGMEKHYGVTESVGAAAALSRILALPNEDGAVGPGDDREEILSGVGQ